MKFTRSKCQYFLPRIVFLVLYLKLIIKAKVRKTLLPEVFVLHFMHKSVIYSSSVFVEGVRSLCSFRVRKVDHCVTVSCEDCHLFFAPLLKICWLHLCVSFLGVLIVLHWSVCLFFRHITLSWWLYLYLLKSDQELQFFLLFQCCVGSVSILPFHISFKFNLS